MEENTEIKAHVVDDNFVPPVVEEVAETVVETPEQVIETPAVEQVIQEIDDNAVLSHIKSKYGKEVTSIEELFAGREELTPTAAAILKYERETGRGIEDYVKLQRDLDKVPAETLIRDYIAMTEKGIDEDDISHMMKKMKYDEEVDDEDVIRDRKIEFKKMTAKAKEFFEAQKETYKTPAVSADEKREALDFKAVRERAEAQRLEDQKRITHAHEQTERVFGKDFKGFEIDLGDEKMVYNPGNVNEVKETQKSAMNFVNKYVDENGFMKNPEQYHKALYAAMNPDKFAKFFYEQGEARATERLMKDTKNVNMTNRQLPKREFEGLVIREVK